VSYVRCRVRFAAPKGAHRWVRLRIYRRGHQVGQRLRSISSGTYVSVPVGRRAVPRGNYPGLIVVRNPSTNLAVTYTNYLLVR